MSEAVRISASSERASAVPDVAPPEVVARGEHLGGVDWLRLIGIAAIVYYHAATVWYPYAPGSDFAFAGLHALTAAATYFAAASRSARSDGEILCKRFHRVLVPWLAFSALHMALAIRSGHFRASMLWVGGSTHLWFLPFIFVTGCAIAVLARRGMIVRSGASAIGWGAAAMLLLAIEPHIGPRLPTVEPLWQVVNALPSALMGVAVFAIPRRGGNVMLVTVLALATVLASLFEPANAKAWAGAAAFGAMLFAVARLLPIRGSAASAFAGRTSFGVYLLHMLVLTIVVRLTNRAAGIHPDAVAEHVHTIMIIAQVMLAVVVCMAIVAILERTPLRRFVG